MVFKRNQVNQSQNGFKRPHCFLQFLIAQWLIPMAELPTTPAAAGAG
jgi:hypothetical protein